MLPATGLFRSINCPFFEKDSCTRPFCHFRHLKPATPKATYCATPKSLLNQNNAAEVSQDGPAKKKPKLEYIPMPTILTSKYVPSAKAICSSGEQSKAEETKPDQKSDDEVKTGDSLVRVEQTDSIEKELTNGQNGKEQKHDDEKKTPAIPIVKECGNKKEEPTALDVKSASVASETKRKDADKNTSTGNSVRKSNHESSKQRKSSKDEKEHRKDRSDRKESERKSSTSGSNERKHSSSTSSSSHRDGKHRSRSDKEKDREKDRMRSKHKDSSRDKEKRSDKEKERTKSLDKDKDKDRGKPTDKDRHRSSQNSSKSSSKSSSRTPISTRKHSSSSNSKVKPSEAAVASSSSKPKVELADEIYRDLLDNPPSDIDIDSDEDEVMRQCRMIFEEYEDEPVTAPAPAVEKAPKKKPDPKPGTDVELIDMFAEKCYDENRKKRVAHESGSNAVQAGVQPPPAKRINHVQNAMRSVYHRQEIVRRQQEELATKQQLEEENKKRIEEETRKAMSKSITPKLSNGSPRSPVLSPTPIMTPPTTDKSPVSPISTNSFYSKPPDSVVTTTPRSRFTPAVNVLAFQKAKEKIEQLRKMKGIGTTAQTVPKGTGRVAHMASAVAAPVASTSSATTAAAPPPPPAKPVPPVLEADSTKISYNIRMQFYNLMIKHSLNIYTSCEDAYERAQTEELAVVKKCNTPMIYKSSALLAINKLRKEAVESGSESAERNKTISHDVILAGKMSHNISWSVNKKLKTDVKSTYTIDNAPSTVAYKMIYDCILTEEQLKANGFPRATDTPGKAKIYTPKPSRPPNEDERYCSRCSKVYNLETYDELAVDSCNYHAKSTCYRRGFADNMHSCCQQPAGTAGCMYGNYHVSSYMNYDDLNGFVKTIEPAEGYVPSKKDIYALDCEMCYTTGGLELTRVTVVDMNEKTVYDSLVKPSNKVIDYNTRFSGITEQTLQNTTTTLYNVQAVLLSMFNSESILIGHSLESDFKALKLIHDIVVDTSVLYPHKMGPPKKRALKTLCIENLKKIIQESDHGHDSAEDSVVCIQLIKHYLRNRII
ncbi:RNA exonuclease 1 homolog isoform X2 [Ochlerotatus camptorhynchus]|uniref:RNA exonuclease 1 homolog isoform X2 n=1 Tax=Ochlerotatus camptorhynchus TaxID=644619 RepID=UPI0031D87050